jgi:hypothetical protein
MASRTCFWRNLNYYSTWRGENEQQQNELCAVGVDGMPWQYLPLTTRGGCITPSGGKQRICD